MSDLQPIIALIKANKKTEARQRLINILKNDPDNEKAWLCMASCATTQQQIETCVQNILRINPSSASGHKLAQRYHIPLDLSETLPSHPTVLLRPDPIDEALATINEALADAPPPQNPRPKRQKDSPSPNSHTTSNEQGASLKKLRYIVASCMLLIIILALLFIGRDQYQKSNAAATLTFVSLDRERPLIEQANAATLTAEYQRATQYTATETAYNATETARYQLATERLDYVLNISTASLQRGPDAQLEANDAFPVRTPIYVLLDLAAGIDLFQVDIQISRQDLNGETPLAIQGQVVGLNPTEQRLQFSFDSSQWLAGTYTARVYIDRQSGPETVFRIEN